MIKSFEMTDEQKKLHKEYENTQLDTKKWWRIGRENFHPSTLDMLHKRGDCDDMVAKNPNTSKHTLQSIIKKHDTVESNSSVRAARMALENPNVGADFLEKYNCNGVKNGRARSYLMRGVAKNPNTPQKRLNHLFEEAKKDNDLSMFYILASNKSLPKGLKGEARKKAQNFIDNYGGNAPPWYDI